MSGQDVPKHRSGVEQLLPAIEPLMISAPNVDLSLDLDEILRATCKAAVDLLKVGHSGLMVFDSEHENGHVISEYPPLGMKGLKIPLHGPAKEQIVTFRQPIAVPDISRNSSFNLVSKLMHNHGIESVLVVPLISKDTLIGSLGLDMIGEPREFTDEEIKLAQVFAQQAAAVIELYKQNIEKAEQLAAIQSTALALKADERELRRVLDTVTREAVQLVGAKDGGISQFHPDRGELTVIADYKFPHMIGTTIKVWEGLAGEVIGKNLLFKAVPDYDKYAKRATVYAKTRRFGAVLMINLKWQGHTVGVLYINAERGREFPSEFLPSLALLANTAAIAIANAYLIHQTRSARDHVRSSFEVGTVLVSHPDSKALLQEIADQMLKAAGASWVRVIIFDEKGERHNFLATNCNKRIDPRDRIRPGGISERVRTNGRRYCIPDVSKATEQLNEAMIEEGCRAALCLPLSEQRGVVWVHYLEPRKFSENNLHLLDVYLNQAFIAYDHTRQMEELDPLRPVAEGLAVATNTKDVLQRIVTSARDLFQADYAVVWAYFEDQKDMVLPVREAVTAGIDEALRRDLWDVVIPVGEITRFVMREGWLPVPDITETTQLPEISLGLLKRLEAKSFEGLCLAVSGEILGLVYLIHKNQRSFEVEETKKAFTFATHAALALKKAKVIDKAASTQMRVVELRTLANLVDLEKTLSGIVAVTKDTLQCDAVTLFVYNEETDRILPLTTMTGVMDMKLATHCEDAPRDSIVYRMLERDEPYCVPRVEDDEIFRKQQFTRREDIKSVCAVPLKFDGHRLGIMFINYRTPHTITQEELDLLDPIVRQASIAIFDGLGLRKENDLENLSRELLGAKSLPESLELAVKNAAAALHADFVAIVLLDEDEKLQFAGWLGWTESDVEDYKKEQGTTQTRFTISEGGPVVVPDYSKETRFDVPKIVESKGITCGISVPMFSGARAEGAMLVHFLNPRHFLKAQTRPLSLIANFTAIAVQHHKAVESKLISLSAVKRASDEISKIRLGTEQKEVLDRIVEQVVGCLPQSFLGTIQLYDQDRNILRFESVHPNDDLELTAIVGDEQLLERRPGNKIGISGRAVLKALAGGVGAEPQGQPEIVDDVSQDPDYRTYCLQTKSELAVPLLTEDGDVLGVLNVESKKQAAYTKDDGQALLALAKLVVTTIQNAEQYRLLEGSTLLAWFGMASSTWGHSIAQKSLNIRNNVELLRQKLKNYGLELKAQDLLDDKLNVVDDMAAQIRQEPIIALLHSTEGLADVHINDLIATRVERLWRNAPYKDTDYKLKLAEEDPIVRCNPDWIMRMLDILIDNAINAMSGMASATLNICTRLIESRKVEVAITDNGPGIPMGIRDKLFKQKIEKDSTSKSLGLGLLMVQVIAHVYKGKVGISRTGPTGTTIYIQLPVMQRNPAVSEDG